jgi:hypothetical protein
VIRAHQAVPDVEVQPEVGPKAFVVHGVVRRRVQELTDPGVQKPAGKDFVPAVPQHVERNLPDHEQQERRRMDRTVQATTGAMPACTKASRVLNE